MRILALLLPLLTTSEAFFFSFVTEEPESTTSRESTLLSIQPEYIHRKVPYNNVHYRRKPASDVRLYGETHVTSSPHHHQYGIVTTEPSSTLSNDHEEAPLQHYFQSRSLKDVVDTAASMLSLFRRFRSDKNVTTDKTAEYKITKPVKTSEYVITKKRNL